MKALRNCFQQLLKTLKDLFCFSRSFKTEFIRLVLHYVSEEFRNNVITVFFNFRLIQLEVVNCLVQMNRATYM